ncbi:histidine kinase [Streptomyces sp. NPDC051940]|uniref:sensor histidine kinase n=1 Tax=Streptomyces sp. NPDC051940 TaxID=3155675 RepID=UPI003417E9A8
MGVVVGGAFAAVYVLAGAPLALVALAVHLAQVLWKPTARTLLAAQAAAGYTAVAATDASVGVLGFTGCAALLALPRRIAWPALAGVTSSAALLGSVDDTISMALISLVLYGLTTLTRRASELHAARLGLAVAATAEERLAIAAELGAGLGRGLARIAAGAQAALARPDRAQDVLAEVTRSARGCLADARASAAGWRAMSLAPELTTARAMLTAAGIEAEVRSGHTEPLGPAGAALAHVLREAVTDVVGRGTATGCLIETRTDDGRIRLRIVSDGARTAEDDSLGDLPARLAEAGGSLATGLTPQGRPYVEAAVPATRQQTGTDADDRAYRLSFVLLATVLAGFCVKALLQLPGEPLLLAAAALGLVAIVGLQLSSVHGRHPVRLALMAGLTWLPVPFFGEVWLGVAGFLAGPLLLALPRRLAWPAVALVAAGVAGAGAALGLPGAVTVNYTVSTLVTGLVVYGLLRLAQIVRELQEARQRLARAAVVEERLRAARDLHDLLGHSLAAILLKCELARRLPPERARTELEDVLTMTRRGEADLRAASGGVVRLSLATEAESARSVLAAASIDAAVTLDHGELPEDAETVLGAALREAVTNVLRHSAATRCAISTARRDGDVLLVVRNDGAPTGAGGRRGSSGIGNLTTRLATLRGTLSASASQDGWFVLEAQLPAPVVRALPVG